MLLKFTFGELKMDEKVFEKGGTPYVICIDCSFEVQKEFFW